MHRTRAGRDAGTGWSDLSACLLDPGRHVAGRQERPVIGIDARAAGRQPLGGSEQPLKLLRVARCGPMPAAFPAATTVPSRSGGTGRVRRRLLRW